MSEKTRGFWSDKRRMVEEILRVVEKADVGDEGLSQEERKARLEYFESSKAAWEVGLGVVLQKLSTDLVGPYALGTFLSSLSLC